MNAKQWIALLVLTAVSGIHVRAQEITMFPGFWNYQYYEDDTRITTKDLVTLFEKNDESLAHWKKSKTFNTLSGVALGSEIGFLVWELSEYDPYGENDVATSVGFYSSFAIGLTFLILSNNQKKKAILSYNKSLQKPSAFKIGPSRSGLGVVVSF